ncbi:hypothetical protein [Marinobacter sp.]|uniref:hypothetical protein n=1 Tax=Marinobacter sp. TaxID=50741 RepID=UPI00384C7D39
MADETEDQPSPERVRRGRRMVLLLFAIGFGPMILATVMYYTGWLNPAGHSNHGLLVSPPVPVSELKLEGPRGEALETRFGPQIKDPDWLLLIVAQNCGDECQQLLYLARQVNVALGKNADRLSRAAWVEQVPEDLAGSWNSEYPSMGRLKVRNGESPDWPPGVDPGEAPEILVIDPFGNIMMRYTTEHSGKEMLEDLKHLLKLSQIG